MHVYPMLIIAKNFIKSFDLFVYFFVVLHLQKLSIWSTFPMMPTAESKASNGSFIRGLRHLAPTKSDLEKSQPSPLLHSPPIDPAMAQRGLAVLASM